MYRIGISALLVVLLGLAVATGRVLYVQFQPSAKYAAANTSAHKITPDPINKSVNAKVQQGLSQTKDNTVSIKPEPSSPPTSSSPIDVALIDSTGTSVIAGSAKPKSKVVVSADGVEVATVESDANGDWVLTTEHKFKTPSPDINVVTLEPEEPSSSSPSQDPKQPALPEGKPNAAPSPPVAEVAQPGQSKIAERLTQKFEKLVETARKEKAKQVELQPSPRADAAQPEITNQDIVKPDHSASTGVSETKPVSAKPLPPTANVSKVQAPDRAPPTSQKIAAAAEKTAVSSSRKQPAMAPRRAATIPIPIGFVYREDTLTEQGRRAILLLAEYLTIKEFKSVILTGHADERGSERLNLGLSQARLSAVAQELKKRGYAGNLELIAKGESEPYAEVDRSQLSKQELYTLDRRVELKEAH